MIIHFVSFHFAKYSKPLEQPSTSAILPFKWKRLLGKASGYAKAAHVILQQVVTMFLKSEQQIIREKLQL